MIPDFGLVGHDAQSNAKNSGKLNNPILDDTSIEED